MTGESPLSDSMLIVDSYTHCGLSKYEPIEQVQSVMDQVGVQRAVLAQHIGEYDNSYIGGIAASKPQQFAAVGMVDHESPSCVGDLEKWECSGQIKGVRIMADAFTFAPHLFDAAANLKLIVLLYTPDGVVNCVPALESFLTRHPGCRLVLTHLGNPDGIDGPAFENYADVLRLAQFEGVYFQVSGMNMLCQYPHELFYGLLDRAFEAFGPSRLCWGSNYPVVGGMREYQMDLELLLHGKLPIQGDAIRLVAGENANHLWFS